MIGFDVAFDAGRQRVGFSPSLCSEAGGSWNGTASSNASGTVCGVDPDTGALVSCGTARTMDKGRGGSRDKGGAAAPAQDEIMGVPVAFVAGTAAVAAALAVAAWAFVTLRGRSGLSRGRGRYVRTARHEREAARASGAQESVEMVGAGEGDMGEAEGGGGGGGGPSLAHGGAAGAAHEVGAGGWGEVGEAKEVEAGQSGEGEEDDHAGDSKPQEDSLLRPGTTPRSSGGTGAPPDAARPATPPLEE